MFHVEHTPARSRSAGSSPSRFQPRRDFAGSGPGGARRVDPGAGDRPADRGRPAGRGFRDRRGGAAVAGGRAGRSRGCPISVREKRSDRDLLEAALVENLQREDLNPLEAAEAYARLREEFPLTQDQIADRVGKDRATVANSLRLLKLSSTVRDKVRSGELSAGHAKALRRPRLHRRPGDAGRGDPAARPLGAPDREARGDHGGGRSGRRRNAPRSLHPRRRGEALAPSPDAGPHRRGAAAAGKSRSGSVRKRS